MVKPHCNSAVSDYNRAVPRPFLTILHPYCQVLVLPMYNMGSSEYHRSVALVNTPRPSSLTSMSPGSPHDSLYWLTLYHGGRSHRVDTLEMNSKQVAI